jgi:hypothetical protein
MMPHAEHAVPFETSLPPSARAWVWLPFLTVVLCLDLPTGYGTVFQVYRCPQREVRAYNVAQMTPEGPDRHHTGP